MLYREYQPGTIKVESPDVTSDSRQVVERLERIAEHYRQLEELLTSIETQLPDSSSREPATSQTATTSQAGSACQQEAAGPKAGSTPSQQLRRRKPR
ncbi:MAG: hypothetical protein ACK56J_17990 [Planctomycetota bacterium]|jgi:hypothetical protein